MGGKEEGVDNRMGKGREGEEEVKRSDGTATGNGQNPDALVEG